MKELEKAQLRKNESNLIQAFKSFFNRAAMKQENDQAKPEYDTFEQVVAQKFDTRMQIVFLRNDFAQDVNDALDHPNYLVDHLKTKIFKQLMRQKRNLEAIVE